MGECKVTLLIICIHLFGSGIKAYETCMPTECTICDVSDNIDHCPQCNQSCYNNVSAHCRQDFNVTLIASSNKVQKSKDATVTCVHNLPRDNISISWIVNKNLREGADNETLQILEITEKHEITCNISSICGNFGNTTTIDVDVDGSVDIIILLICVLAAFFILLSFAIVMKIIQSKGQAQREARSRQREQDIQNIHSTATTSTSYW